MTQNNNQKISDYSKLLKDLEVTKKDLEAQIYKKTDELEQKNKKLVEEIKQRKKTEKKINSLNDCLASFSNDSRENIKKIIKTTGIALNATTIAYSKVENNKLLIIESWNLSDPIIVSNSLKDHLCYYLMNKKDKDKVLCIDNLEKSKYAKTDPNIEKFNIKSYIGATVNLRDNQCRSLCAVFTSKQKFSKYDKKMIFLLAKFIEIEENRLQAQQKIINAYNYLAKINRKITILSNFKNSYKNNLSEVCNYITNSATNFSSASKCLLYIFENDDHYELKSYQGFVSSEVMQIHENLIKSQDIFNKIKKTKTRLQIDLTNKQKKYKTVNLYNLSSMLILPLISKNQVFGMIVIFFQNLEIASNQELEFFEVLVNQASLNIEIIMKENTENSKSLRIEEVINNNH